jgi:hypothetical protein
MEIGLALRLVAPPACLSRRRRALAPPCAPRGSRVWSVRRERSSRAGAVASGGLSYAVVEEEEMDVEEEGDARPRLELIEKPDRNLALLDEYESEELGASLCANHRSGEPFSSPLFLCFYLQCFSVHHDVSNAASNIFGPVKPGICQCTLIQCTKKVTPARHFEQDSKRIERTSCLV